MWSLVRLTDPVDMTIVAVWDTGIEQENEGNPLCFNPFNANISI